MAKKTAREKDDPNLLSTRDLARRWSMSPGTLENWRRANRGPRWLALGRGPHPAIRYMLMDVQAYEKKLRARKRR